MLRKTEVCSGVLHRYRMCMHANECVYIRICVCVEQEGVRNEKSVAFSKGVRLGFPATAWHVIFALYTLSAVTSDVTWTPANATLSDASDRVPPCLTPSTDIHECE